MKVLIVDDDKVARGYFRDVCEAKGFDVFVAENGILGFKEYKEQSPDLVISDIEMPYMDGFNMVEKIRKKDGETIILVVTSSDTKQYAVKAMECGANNFLRKAACRTDLSPLLDKYESITRSLCFKKKVVGMITERRITLYLENQVDDLPDIINRILNETGSAIDISDRTGVHLGLLELVVNAIEHGNLEISYSDKTTALEKNTLRELYDKRLEDEHIKKRKVKIEFLQDANGYQWIISDEGAGFDWENMADPLHDENLIMNHGRGIFLARYHFDELEFIGKGNVVRARKYN